MTFHMLQRFADESVAIRLQPGGKWTVDPAMPLNSLAMIFAGQQNRWIRPWFAEAVAAATVERLDEVTQLRRAA